MFTKCYVQTFYNFLVILTIIKDWELEFEKKTTTKQKTFDWGYLITVNN